MLVSPVVLDTNILLDLWVFQDPRGQALLQSLQMGQQHWIATLPMREELQCVLKYSHIAQRLQQQGSHAETVLAHFDALSFTQPVAPKAPITCKDPDDQKFIDLAVQHKAPIWSKDNAVRCMTKRLQTQGVIFCAWP